MKFTSRVISGRKHGRTIGYPTANLEINQSVKKVLGREGVYAARVKISGKEYVGALFYGKRTLFGDTEPVCEVLLLSPFGRSRVARDFESDLYGRTVAVEAIQYLRPPVEVKDEEGLKELIKKDINKIYALPRSRPCRLQIKRKNQKTSG